MGDSNILTAQHIMRNITLLTFMIPVGIMISSNVLVGNNIGANKVAKAKAYGMMCFKSALVWASVTVLLLIIFKNPFTGLFSGETLILDIITKVYPVMLIFVFVDCI